jgi:hypothetical protein
MDHSVDRRRLPNGWVAWLLVLVALLPTVLVIRLGWLVFDGSWDGFVGQSQSEGMTLLGERWTNFWWASPAVPSLLIAGVLPLLLLTVIVITDRPRALVPTTAARHAATAVAVTTALLGLVGTAGFVAQFSGLLPVQAWPSYGSSVQDAFAPFAAVTVVYVGLSLAVVAALWPQQGQEQGQRGGEGSVPDRSVGEETTEDEAATPRAVPETAETAETVRAQPQPLHPGPPQPATPPNLPTPSASDLDLYRRR